MFDKSFLQVLMLSLPKAQKTRFDVSMLINVLFSHRYNFDLKFRRNQEHTNHVPFSLMHIKCAPCCVASMIQFRLSLQYLCAERKDTCTMPETTHEISNHLLYTSTFSQHIKILKNYLCFNFSYLFL